MWGGRAGLGEVWCQDSEPPAPLQELCKQLHAKIDVAEEEKYDMEMKVQKSTKEVSGRGALYRGGAPGPRARPLLPSPPHPCSWRT